MSLQSLQTTSDIAQICPIGDTQHSGQTLHTQAGQWSFDQRGLPGPQEDVANKSISSREVDNYVYGSYYDYCYDTTFSRHRASRFCQATPHKRYGPLLLGSRAACKTIFQRRMEQTAERKWQFQFSCPSSLHNPLLHIIGIRVTMIVVAIIEKY